MQTKKKKGKNRGPIIKYGVEVPESVKHAIRLDAENRNTYWKDAMNLEIKALNDMRCFEYRAKHDKPDDNYQFIQLHMVFDAKQDHCRKACLVAGGRLINLLEN